MTPKQQELSIGAKTFFGVALALVWLGPMVVGFWLLGPEGFWQTLVCLTALSTIGVPLAVCCATIWFLGCNFK